MSKPKSTQSAAALLLLTVALTGSFGSCGGASGAGAGPAASADLGAMAPAADGRPLSAGIDDVELGMSAAEVAAAWGEPLSDSYSALEYGGRDGWAKVLVSSLRRDHGDVIYMMTLTPGEERKKQQTLPELIERFGPPVTEAAEAAMIRMAAVGISESETLFRAGRYVYAIAEWQSVAEDGLLLSELQLVMHPQAVLDVPRSEWAALRYPFPITLPQPAREQLKALLRSDATAEEIEDLLGPPVWKHPGSLDRDAWRYIFWDSMIDVELYFTDGVLNGYQTQGLEG